MTHLIIIRDPIHNYIAASQLERLLIDHPLFQRLRYVSQNGLAHLVYPSNRTSRFLHSLGAMHLSGQFLLRGVANAARNDAKLFWERTKSLISGARGIVLTNDDAVAEYLRLSDDPFYRECGFDPTYPADVDKIVLLQATRLAAVMHDLGHLPFSHTLEHVLMDSRRPGRADDSDERRAFETTLSQLSKTIGPLEAPLHELIGKALMQKIFRGIDTAGYRDFAILCFRVASDIAHHKDGSPDRFGVLACLHSIVSGEIDADRCDYVRRDGHASGFEFGDFDLHRILSSLRFTDRKGSFALIPTTVSTSALESFFLERYRIYRWLVFHPMVLRADLALSRALTILLEIWFREVPDRQVEPIRRLLERWDFSRLWTSFESPDTYDRYIGCEENWLLSLLRDVQRALQDTTTTQDVRVLAMKVYLDLVCDRRKEYLRPLWKRQEDYRTFASHVVASLSARPLPPDWARRAQEDDISWCNRVSGLAIEAAVAAKVGRISVLRSLENAIQTRLAARDWEGGIVATLLKFSPYKPISVIETRAANREVPLEELSTIVAGLGTMWSREMQFRPYWFARKHEVGTYRLVASTEARGPSIEDFASAFSDALLEIAD